MTNCEEQYKYKAQSLNAFKALRRRMSILNAIRVQILLKLFKHFN